MERMNLFGNNDKSSEALSNRKEESSKALLNKSNQNLSTINVDNYSYQVDFRSDESCKSCVQQINKDTGKSFKVFREKTGKENYVLYDSKMYEICEFNYRYLHYIESCSKPPVMPFNASSCYNMFAELDGQNDIDFNHFDTSEIVEMTSMFMESKFKTLDLSHFSTDNLKDTSFMFMGCRELLEIKTAGKERFGINAPKHNDIYKMCDLLNPALESLSALAPIQDEKGNLTFTLSDIFSKRRLAETRFSALFNKVYVVNVLSEESREKCLKELEADTGKKFAWLKESYGKEHWVLYDTDVFEVRGIDEYLHIKKLWCAPHIPVNATTCHLMFRGCGNIDFSNFYTNNVVDMSYMFYNADNTIKLDLSRFDTSKVETMEAMFSNMYALKYFDVSSFSTERLTNMDAMFDNCVNLVNLDLTSFDTGSVLYMLNTFSGCEQLEEILVSDKWSVCWGIEDGDRTFDGAKKLPNYNHVTTGADKGYDNRCGGYLTFK